MRQEGTIECLLVTEIWQSNERVHWQSTPVPNMLLKETGWDTVHIQMPISKPLTGGQTLCIYLWLTRNGGRAWMDEVNLRLEHNPENAN